MFLSFFFDARSWAGTTRQVGVKSFKSRSLQAWQEAGAGHLFPVDPAKVLTALSCSTIYSVFEGIFGIRRCAAGAGTNTKSARIWI